MDKNKKISKPKNLKRVMSFTIVILFLFILSFVVYVYFFDPMAGICNGIRNVDGYFEEVCFDNQYLEDFKSNPAYFMSNIDSYAISVVRIKWIVDKMKCARDHETTYDSYIAIRENGELKEVSREEVDSFLDSYCEDCLICYEVTSWEPLFETNLSSIWDYHTKDYYCVVDNFTLGSWYCANEPVPKDDWVFLYNHTIEGIQLNYP